MPTTLQAIRIVLSILSLIGFLSPASGQNLKTAPASEEQETEVGNVYVRDTSNVLQPVLIFVEGPHTIKVCRMIDSMGVLKRSCWQSDIAMNTQFNTYNFIQNVGFLLRQWDDLVVDDTINKQITNAYEAYWDKEVLVRTLEADQVAAKMVLQERVPVWKKLTPQALRRCRDQCRQKPDPKSQDDCRRACSTLFERTDQSFVIEEGKFYLYRGYIASLEIRGYVQKGDTVSPRLVLNNVKHKLSFFPTVDEFFTFSLPGKEDHVFAIRPHQSFDLQSENKADKHFQDKAFTLRPGEAALLNRMGISDYLSINIASDALGLNLNNASGFLRNSFVLNLPVNMKGRGRWHVLPFFQAGLSYFVINGEGQNSGYKKLESLGQDSLLFVDYFDFVRYQNVRFNLEWALLGAELNQVATVNLISGQNLYRSGFNYTRVNKLNNQALSDNFSEVSFAYYLELLAQYRPAADLGADLSYALNYFGRFKLNNSNPNFEIARKVESLPNGQQRFLPLEDWHQRLFFSFNLFAYGKTGNRGGVFAEVTGDFTFGSNDDGIYPSILIGYSTNLSAFVSSQRR